MNTPVSTANQDVSQLRGSTMRSRARSWKDSIAQAVGQWLSTSPRCGQLFRGVLFSPTSTHLKSSTWLSHRQFSENSDCESRSAHKDVHITMVQFSKSNGILLGLQGGLYLARQINSRGDLAFLCLGVCSLLLLEVVLHKHLDQALFQPNHHPHPATSRVIFPYASDDGHQQS